VGGPQSDFDRLDAALARVETGANAAESHGILCGLLCVRSRAEPAEWTGLFLEETSPGDALSAECARLLGRLREQTIRQLDSPDYNFQPLLPDERKALARRTQFLGNWCSGYLYGLGMAGDEPFQRLSDEAREFVVDLGEITRIDADPQAGEDNEAAFAEVLEYVRVGVLMVYEDLRAYRESRGRETVH
jgi:yecA family protein